MTLQRFNLHLALFSRYLEEPTMIAAFNGKQTGKHVVHIACGSTYSAAVTADGELYTWGRGNYGRLGHGKPRPTPGPAAGRAIGLKVLPLCSRLQRGPDHAHAGDGAEGTEGDGRGVRERGRTDPVCDGEW